MANTKGTAIWEGGLKEGRGNVETDGPALRGTYNYATRFGEDNTGTNPEELIGAAHAACYSMFLASLLEKAGHPAIEIKTTTAVILSKDDIGPFIKKLIVSTHGDVPGINQEQFEQYAETAEKNCPVARALAAVPEVMLEAVLKQ